MRLRRLSSGSPVRLAAELGRGGEGTVFDIHGHADLVAKIYKQAPSALKVEKLRAMTRGATSAMLQVAAWPIDVLVDERSQVHGFLMRKVSSHEDLHELYSPKSRAEVFPNADFRFVVRVAINVARAFARIHSQGHVIGDVNHGNAVVFANGDVHLIDCDSFQTRDRIKTYPCDVGVPLFTPPELQGQSFRGLRRSPNHDAFGLAVLIFHLLFQGRHPFAGRYQQGELTIERAIAEHRFAYGGASERTGMLPPPGTLPLDSFGSVIAQLFERAFEMSAAQGERPTAVEWIGALEALEGALVQCESKPAHVHPSPGTCCWCTLERKTGITLFGKRLAVLAEDVVKEAEALWQVIGKVAHPGPMPAPPSKTQAFSARPDVVKLIKTLESQVFVVVTMGVIVSFVLLVNGGTRVFGAGTLMFLGIIAVLMFESRRGRKQRSALARAKSTWDALLTRWRRECSSEAFDVLLSQLRDAKLEIDELTGKREHKLEQLALFYARRSRREFLQGFHIDGASSQPLPSKHRAKLRSHGITTAADIDRRELDLPVILGRKAADEVVAWYRMHLRDFEGPIATPSPSEIAAIEDRFDSLEERLLKQLREGAEELPRMQARILAARARLEKPLQGAYDALSRAQAERHWRSNRH